MSTKSGQSHPLKKELLTQFESKIIELDLIKKTNDLLYRGGFGEVYRANLDPGNQDVVVKSIWIRTSWEEHLAVSDKRPPHLSISCRGSALEAFACELHVWSGLSHANILRLIGYHYDSKSKSLWFISPLMDGGNVRSYLEIQKPNLATRINLVSPVMVRSQTAYLDTTYSRLLIPRRVLPTFTTRWFATGT